MHSFRCTWIFSLLLAAHGNGQFDVVPTAIPCTGCPFPMITDFDGANGPDLLFADGSTMRWMANDGNGAFTGPIELALNPGFLISNLAQDMDGDTDIDVVGITTTFDGTSVWLMRNDGTGFTAVLVDTIGSTYRAPEAAVDLDRDGDLDLLGVDHASGELWYRNNGDGIYQREVIGRWCTNGVKGPYDPVDIEGDGDLDLVGFVDPIGRLIVHWNLGSGRFGPFTVATGFLGHFPAGLAMDAIDVEQDGFTDIVAGGRGLRSTGYGTFAGSANDLDPRNCQSVGNIDCDTPLEAVLSSDGVPSIRDFDLGTGLSYDLAVPGHVRSALADLNGDGRLDLITGAGSGGALNWWMNTAVPALTTLVLPWDTLVNADTLQLSGGDPNSGGGVYSGPGVFDGRLYPLIAGPGYAVITYIHGDFNSSTGCLGTATDSVYITDFTSVAEYARPTLVVYPNPAQDVLTFRADGSGPLHVVVQDMIGREVQRDRISGAGSTTTRTLDIGSLATGCYQLTLSNSEGLSACARFVIER